MPFQPDVPYNALPLLPPQNALVETPRSLRQCIAASRALAALKHAGELMPSQGLLINIVPLLEARASSRIENIVTTRDALFRFASLGEEQADAATKEALSYRKALYNGYKSLAKLPLCTRTASQVCSTIKGRDMQPRQNFGTALRTSTTQRIVYTPPIGEQRIRALLTNWQNYLHDTTLETDPLIKMAVAHYQFEAIHPFEDGNGRTGRVLNTLFLITQDLLKLPTLYLSRFFLRRRQDYYQLLLNVTRQQAWEAWIVFVLQGVEETARWTIHLIEKIRTLMRFTGAHVRQHLPKIYNRDLIDVIFTQPYCRPQNIMQATQVTRQTAMQHLRALARLHIVREVHVGRIKLFLNTALMAQLGTGAARTTPPYLTTLEAVD